MEKKNKQQSVSRQHIIMIQEETRKQENNNQDLIPNDSRNFSTDAALILARNFCFPFASFRFFILVHGLLIFFCVRASFIAEN